jgi:hypothetical protein
MFLISPAKFPIGENSLENRVSTGENTVATDPLILPAKLTPLRSKVIRNSEETSNKTNKSRERLPPPLATNNSLIKN